MSIFSLNCHVMTFLGVFFVNPTLHLLRIFTYFFILKDQNEFTVGKLMNHFYLFSLLEIKMKSYVNVRDHFT